MWLGRPSTGVNLASRVRSVCGMRLNPVPCVLSLPRPEDCALGGRPRAWHGRGKAAALHAAGVRGLVDTDDGVQRQRARARLSHRARLRACLGPSFSLSSLFLRPIPASAGMTKLPYTQRSDFSGTVE